MTMKTVAAGYVLTKPNEALLVRHGTHRGDAYFRSARNRAHFLKLPATPCESGKIRAQARVSQANTGRMRTQRAWLATETRKIGGFRGLIRPQMECLNPSWPCGANDVDPGVARQHDQGHDDGTASPKHAVRASFPGVRDRCPHRHPTVVPITSAIIAQNCSPHGTDPDSVRFPISFCKIFSRISRF